MKILIFLHGTIIMHKSGYGHTPKERIKQVINEDKFVCDFISYIPIGNAVRKLQEWKKQGAKIMYLSSHIINEDVEKDKFVLEKHNFPEGQIFHCKENEDWQDVIKKIKPDIIIEDNCKSIGGIAEMTYPNLSSELKENIKPVVVEEFTGIDYLPDEISKIKNY